MTAKATAEYSCGHAVLLSGYDEGHKKQFHFCPICGKGEMEEMRELIT